VRGAGALIVGLLFGASSIACGGKATVPATAASSDASSSGQSALANSDAELSSGSVTNVDGSEDNSDAGPALQPCSPLLEQCDPPQVCIQLPGSNGGHCGAPCQSDGDCPAWLTCSAGVCSLCAKCGAGQSCEPVTGLRVPPAPCGANSECQAGLYCGGTGAIQGRCTFYLTCQSCGSSCPNCAANSDCNHGQVCLGGSCTSCTTDSQCGPSARCTMSSPKPSHAVGPCTCTAGSDCAAGEACSSTGQPGLGLGLGICAPACKSNNDCHNGYVCGTGSNGAVEQPEASLPQGACGPCTSNSQCGSGPGATCSAGSCSCSTATDCAPGQGCGGTPSLCGACVASSECSNEQACIAGACGPCSTFADCNTSPVGVAPTTGLACVNGACGPCSSNRQCGGGQACAQGTCGTCIVNSQCGSNGQCANGFCTCSTNQQCAAGQRCGSGVCVAM
jgi:hypothetical protein